MSDLISRQAAIEGLYDVFFDDELSAAYPKEADKVLDVIRKLPSAQPERCEDCVNFSKTRLLIPQPQRKMGRWQITEAYPHNIYCSECHTKFAQTHWAVWEDGSLPRKYCPNCGAKMDGENDE